MRRQYRTLGIADPNRLRPAVMSVLANFAIYLGLRQAHKKTMSATSPRKILFVCLGNICRSPAAEGVFTHLASEAGLPNPLPKGASAIAALQATARRIITRQGATALGRYAKLNFKPVRELLERAT